MENFEYVSPTRFILEEDADLRCGELVKRHSNSVLFVHYGDQFIYKSGLYNRIIESCQNHSVKVFELVGVEPNPKIELVREGITLCKKENIEFILAVGGGSVIDTAKAISIGAKYEYDVWDFFTKEEEPKEALKIGVVMTLPGTGSEASNGSVITNEKTGENLDVMSDILRPTFALMNPKLTLSIPKEQTGYGIIDMFSHVMERYMSRSKNSYVTDAMCEGLMKAIKRNGYILMDDLDNEAARRELMWAAIIAHNGVLGVGRMQDWASHQIAAQLSAQYNTVHAAALSVVIPNWAQYVCTHHLTRFVQFAQQVFNIDVDYESMEDTAHQGISAMQQFFIDMGGVTSLRDLNIDSKDKFDIMSSDAVRFGNIGNIKQLNKADVKEIYERAF